MTNDEKLLADIRALCQSVAMGHLPANAAVRSILILYKQRDDELEEARSDADATAPRRTTHR